MKVQTVRADETAVREEQRKHTKHIVSRLEVLYGVPEWHPRLDPLEELVACILSQHTSDINSFRAFERLRAKYPTWRAVEAAPAVELADTIRCGGLADSKAPRIQAVLRAVESRYGALELTFLKDLSDGEARAWLMSLPGVGPKTAGIVLCFAMGRNVLPVDTHVFRVSWRLGLIEKKIGEARAHDALQAQIAPEMTYRFHMALIRHGRQICKALTPPLFILPPDRRMCILCACCRSALFTVTARHSDACPAPPSSYHISVYRQEYACARFKLSPVCFGNRDKHA